MSALPGLERVGSVPDPTAAAPNDIARRSLRQGAVRLLARQALERARKAGTPIYNPLGYLAAAERTIAAQRAVELDDAVETALARWSTPDAAHVVSALTEAVTGHVTRPLERSAPEVLPPPPLDEVRAGLESARSAMRRTG